MKLIFAFVFIISAFTFAFGQNEESPVVAKEFVYKNWTFKNLNGDGETSLRQFAKGKKLVMVVYYAPWCPNWKHDVGFVQELHQKYAKDGLAVIGVGEYDTVEKIRQNYQQNKLTFPSVYESTALTDRLLTFHYAQRTIAGDTRKWGSPWYVFLEPSNLVADGEVLSNKHSVVNGELIRQNAEKFIREKLGLGSNGALASASSKEIEVCEPTQQTTLVKP